MARYTTARNVWNMSPDERAALQPGQWVTAGGTPDAPRGRYMGQKAGGTDVVAWCGNAAQHPRGTREYNAALRQYARA